MIAKFRIRVNFAPIRGQTFCVETFRNLRKFPRPRACDFGHHDSVFVFAFVCFVRFCMWLRSFGCGFAALCLSVVKFL